jgi:hypothetical protein
MDRLIRRLKDGQRRGINGIFAVGEREGHAVRLLEDKRKGVRAVRVSCGAPESGHRFGLEIGDMPGKRATGPFGTDTEGSAPREHRPEDECQEDAGHGVIRPPTLAGWPGSAREAWRGVQTFPHGEGVEPLPRNDEPWCRERAGGRTQTVRHPESWDCLHGQLLAAMRSILVQ